jgi:hypothetical protein
MTTDQIVNAFIDLVTYVTNGALETFYFLLDRAPQLIAIACALFILLTFDRWAQQQAVFAPDRYRRGRAAETRPPRFEQALSLVTLGLWLLASWTFGPPVPLLGAVMWLGATLSLAMMPQQRWSLLWTTKAGLVIYSVAILVYRIAIWYFGRLTPAQLSEVFNGTASANSILTRNTSTITTVGAWALWVIVPAGYLWLLGQNWLAQRLSIVSPWAGVSDVLSAIRSRGNPGDWEEN